MTDRAEWLEDRRKGIGGSDVAGVLGLSPWASPYSVWASKVFPVADDDRDTLAMSFGRRAEVMIVPWFHELTGLYIAGQQAACIHPEHDHRRCTIDGWVYESQADADDKRRFGSRSPAEPLGCYEAKTTSDTPAEWEAEIPVYYQCQAQWTMHVTGTERCWFAVLHLAFGRPDLKVYELARDQADIDLIVKAVDAFWHDHVVTGIPPETDAHPATTYATKHLPVSGDLLHEMTALDVADLEHLREIKAIVKDYQREIDAIENSIRAALGDCTEGYYDGQLIVSHREQSRPEHVVKASTFRVLRSHLKGESK